MPKKKKKIQAKGLTLNRSQTPAETSSSRRKTQQPLQRSLHLPQSRPKQYLPQRRQTRNLLRSRPAADVRARTPKRLLQPHLQK